MEANFIEKTKNIFYRFLYFVKTTKHKKLISAISVLLFLLLAIPLKSALAAAYDPVLKGLMLLIFTAILGIVAIFAFVIAELSKALFSMMTEMIRWAATAKLGGLTLTTAKGNPFIDAGLGVTLPLANMAFILLFVVVAITTILGIEAYGIKKILPILIIMTVLVNFAPLMVGFIVDFANVITNYFVKGIDFTNFVNADDNQLGNFITGMVNGFGGVFPKAEFEKYLRWSMIGSAACPPDSGCEELEGRNNIGIMTPTLYLVSAAAAMVIGILSLGVMLALFLVRNLFIWLLVIFSPLAFAAYVMPFTRQWFKQWWKMLLQWSFIGVTATFFLYLASVLSNAVNVAQSVPNTDPLLGSIVGLILKTGFPVIIIVIGLFASLKSSAAFSGSVLKGVKKLGKFAGAGLAGYGAIKAAQFFGGLDKLKGGSKKAHETMSSLRPTMDQSGFGRFKRMGIAGSTYFHEMKKSTGIDFTKKDWNKLAKWGAIGVGGGALSLATGGTSSWMGSIMRGAVLGAAPKEVKLLKGMADRGGTQAREFIDGKVQKASKNEDSKTEIIQNNKEALIRKAKNGTTIAKISAAKYLAKNGMLDDMTLTQAQSVMSGGLQSAALINPENSKEMLKYYPILASLIGKNVAEAVKSAEGSDVRKWGKLNFATAPGENVSEMMQAVIASGNEDLVHNMGLRKDRESLKVQIQHLAATGKIPSNLETYFNDKAGMKRWGNVYQAPPAQQQQQPQQETKVPYESARKRKQQETGSQKPHEPGFM
jgi:hypothetical protein